MTSRNQSLFLRNFSGGFLQDSAAVSQTLVVLWIMVSNMMGIHVVYAL
jgi:hypothetical protein